MAKKSRKMADIATQLEEIFQWPGYVVKVETTADRGMKVTLHSQELTAQAGSKLLMLKDQYVNVVLKVGRITEEDLIGVSEEVPAQKGVKTPSQRLRGALYVLWQKKRESQRTGGKLEVDEYSDDFYNHAMEKLIEQVKDRIKEYE